MTKRTIDCADPNVLCPFYILEEELKLRCEGFSKETSLHIRFPNKEAKRGHKKTYCKKMDGYETCPLYPVIMAQYEGGEDE